MEIFKLFGSIFIDSADAQNSIQKTGKEAETMGSKLKTGLKTAAKWGAALTAAAVAVGGAMIAAAKDTATNLDAVDKASKRMGIDAESYQELAYAADLSGISMGTLEAAAKKLEGTDVNLDEAITSIMSLGTEAERTQAASELFGESIAYKLEPLLQEGADGFDEMREEANKLGLVMSNDTVSAGASLNDMFTKVEKSTQALKNSILKDLLPYVNEILQWVIDNMPTIQETVKTVMDAVWPLVKAVLDLIMQALPPLLKAVKTFLDWIMPYLKPIISSIGTIVGGLIKLLSGDFDGFSRDVKKAMRTLATAMKGLGKDIINKLKEGFIAAWTNLTSWVSEKVKWLKDKFSPSNIIGDLKNKISGAFGHASGLNYVPYDGYTAVLHRGETVLSSQKSQSLVSDIVNAITPFLGGAGGNITIPLVVDGQTIAEVTYDKLNNIATQRGVIYG